MAKMFRVEHKLVPLLLVVFVVHLITTLPSQVVADHNTVQSNLERCLSTFDSADGTIIKTQESLNYGATYITAEKAVDQNECKKLCCDAPKCNVAVFQQAEKHDCYLFDCGNVQQFKCVFSKHDNYVSMGMMVDRDDLVKTTIHEESKHEMDLSMLKAKETKTEPKKPEDYYNSGPSAQPAPELPRGKNNPYDNKHYSDDKMDYHKSSERVYHSRERDRLQSDYGRDRPDAYGGESDRNRSPPFYDKSRERTYQRLGQQQVNSYDDEYRNPPTYNGRENERFESGGRESKDRDWHRPAEYKQRKRPPPPMNEPKSPMDKQIGDPHSRFQQSENRPPSRTHDNNAAGCRLNDQWLCASGECIPVYDVCDGHPQCKDGSDEQREMCQKPVVVNSDRNSGGRNSDRDSDRDDGLSRSDQELSRRRPDVGEPPNLREPLKPKVGPSPPLSTGNVSSKETILAMKEVTVEKIDNAGTSLAALVLGLSLLLLALFLVYISCRLRKLRTRVRRQGGRKRGLETAEGEMLINGLYL